MAPPSTVPSRAAIHALRGVVLTTSCSVVLLAEERRRRIKIARAAIDNAQKLHTARSHYGPAPGANLSRRENWPDEVSENHPRVSAVAVPKPKGPIRRRRRDPNSDETQYSPEESSPESPETASQAAIANESTIPARPLGGAWKDWNSMRREISRISAAGPFSHHELFRRVSQDSETPNIANKHTPKPKLETVDPSGESLPGTSPQETPDAYQEHIDSLPLETQTYQSPVADPETWGEEGMEFPGQPMDQDGHLSSGNDSELIELLSKIEEGRILARRHHPQVSAKTDYSRPWISAAKTTSTDQSETKSNFRQKPAGFYRLLDDLDSDAPAPREQREALSSAIKLYSQLIKSTHLELEIIVAGALALLETSCLLGEWQHIVPIMTAVFPICNNRYQLLDPFVEMTMHLNDDKALRELFYHHDDLTQPGYDVSPPRSWITELLNRRWHRSKNFRDVQLMFNFFRMKGMFTHNGIAQNTKHLIRRRYIKLALSNGLLDLAAKEFDQARLYMSFPTHIDLEIRASFIVEKARQGHWDRVNGEIIRIRRTGGAKSKHYQRLLANLTTIFAKQHSLDEWDDFVRDLIRHKQMDLNQSLALLVIERHGRNLDMDSLINWLKFCHEEGLRLDGIFLAKVARNCREYWGFDAPRIQELLNDISAFKSRSKAQRLNEYLADGGLTDATNGREAQVDARVEKPDEKSELAIFRSMNALANREDWRQVLEVYTAFQSRGMGFSPRCLRLAAVANIRNDGGMIENAAKLVAAARASGHDVSSALVPLFMAQLEAGAHPEVLVREALRSGEHLHDSVFNVAIRHLIHEGNLRGAMAICHVAAKENGKGNLIYNKYMFCNVIHVYVGLRGYEEIIHIMTTFTSGTESWYGSKECKETVKGALKEVLNQVSDDMELRHQACICLKDGLDHVKAVRASVRSHQKALNQGIMSILESERHVEDSETRVQKQREGSEGGSLEEEPLPMHETNQLTAHEDQSAEEARPLRAEMAGELPRRPRYGHIQDTKERQQAIMPAQGLAGKAF